MKTTYYISDDQDNEIELLIDFTFIPGERGYRDKYGAQETPDYPPEIEIGEIVDKKTGLEYTPTKNQLAEIELKCWEALAEETENY